MLHFGASNMYFLKNLLPMNFSVLLKSSKKCIYFAPRNSR